MRQQAVVELQNLLSPASENPRMQESSLAKCCKQKKRNIKKKQNGSPNLHKDVGDNATYV